MGPHLSLRQLARRKQVSNRSRRLKKKLYLEEFAVYGFAITCELSIDNTADYNAFIDEFLDFVEARDLMIGGGASHNRFDCFVVAQGRYQSPSEEDRSAVSQWFANNGKCSNVEVGELVDVNLDA